MCSKLLIILILFFLINYISSATYSCNRNNTCGCSTSSTIVTSRIVGGEAASDYSWNWIISVRSLGRHICGATLLTPEYAVTAAHCVEDFPDDPSSYSIFAGTNYLNDTNNATIQRRTLIKIISNPDYDSDGYKNDIAIIQFAPLVISSNSKIRFICLPKQDQDPFKINTSLVAIGWGYQKETIRIINNYLEQVTLQVYSSTSATCTKSKMRNATIQFCAGSTEGDKDTCQGDSGGPIMAFVNGSWVLAGITSSGVGCARIGFVGIYTRVSYFIPFINSNTMSSLTTTATTSKVLTMTTIVQNTSNDSNAKQNQGNAIDKPILVFIFSFSFFIFFLSLP